MKSIIRKVLGALLIIALFSGNILYVCEASEEIGPDNTGSENIEQEYAETEQEEEYTESKQEDEEESTELAQTEEDRTERAAEYDSRTEKEQVEIEAAEEEQTEIEAAAEERAASAEELGYVPGEILVGYRDETAEDTVAEAVEEQGGELVETVAALETENVAVVNISDEMTVEKAVEEYMKDPEIEYAEPNYLMNSLEETDSDVQLYPTAEMREWYLNAVHASQAWDRLAGCNGKKVRVAVIDTGVQLDHEELSNVLNKNLCAEVVWNKTSNSRKMMPLRGDGYLNGTNQMIVSIGSGHGTHVSGIIAAESGNGVGIAGVASGGNTAKRNSIVELVVVDAFTTLADNGQETATVADVVYSMQYAKDNGCRVVNLSLGSDKNSTTLEKKCEELKNAGITLVCAAGNDGNTLPAYPSDYDSTISVINVTDGGTRSPGSNYGMAKDISAPGTGIYSTLNGGRSAYGTMSGTSMASPMVAAGATMLLYVNPSLTPGQIENILCNTATDLGAPGKDPETGYGMLNVEAAVDQAAGYPVDNKDTFGLTYRVHAQDYGWMSWVKNKATGGTTGQAKRLEGIQIKLDSQGYSGGIQYRTHVQDIGWQGWKINGAMSGTSGRAKRLEAIQIKLTGEMEKYYDVYYRVHAENFGWMGWAKNGASAGTAGYAYRLEAIQISLVKKGGTAPGSTSNAYRHPLIKYQTHVQDVGWQSMVLDGVTSGTTGRAKRLEGIKISIPNQEYTGSVQYRTHVQNIGWQGWKSNGAMSGTSGKALRLEAIQIKLTGKMAEQYDIYYRVHAQDYGWLGWAKNGASAGTSGMAKRLEGIQIKLVKKGSKAPGNGGRPYVYR